MPNQKQQRRQEEQRPDGPEQEQQEQAGAAGAGRSTRAQGANVWVCKPSWALVGELTLRRRLSFTPTTMLMRAQTTWAALSRGREHFFQKEHQR